VAIYWGSSLPIPALLARIVAISDKLFHAATFAAFAVAVAFALRIAHRTSARKTALLAGFLAAAYGATDEWHQLYVPGRFGDAGDIVADALGAAFAAAAAGWFIARRSAKRLT
jgi:VanZ family protein